MAVLEIHCVDLAGLISQRYAYVCLLSVGIEDMCIYIHPLSLFFSLK